MKTLRLFWFSLGCWFLLAGQTKSPTYGRLTIHSPTANGQPVKLTTPNLFTLSPALLADATFDATGTATLQVPLTSPIFTDVEIGQKRYGLLISPGDELTITLSDQPTTPVRFTGKGAQVASYLTGMNSIWRQYEAKGGKHLVQLDPVGFRNRIDTIQRAYADFSQSFIKNTTLDKVQRQLIDQKSAMQLLSYQLNYAMANYNPTDTSAQASSAMDQLVRQVPLDAELLQANTYEYGFLLSMYLQAGVYAPLTRNKSQAEVTALLPQLPLLADRQIDQAKYPPAVRLFLRAKNLSESLHQGITPATDSLLASLRKEDGYALYEPTISQQYAKWQALLPGQTAPNFSGITTKGEVLSLTDLKGKVVYVDVWATWCVPCRQEFPQAKQLQKRFPNSEQVAFLYVSIDRDAAAWRKFLEDDAEFKGVHMNQPPGEHFNSLWGTYQLSSIPRYMLIDQAGKIVDVNAARPSSGTIASEIDRLLR
jgi:thiol-disulfide isomerase/thioredoxin